MNLDWPSAAVIIAAIAAVITALVQWVPPKKEDHDLKRIRQTLDAHVEKDARRWHVLFRFLARLKKRGDE